MYQIEGPIWTENRWRNFYKLSITDDNGTREYSDYGEPEDNSFGRDYKWIKIELEKAYHQGRLDGLDILET